MACPHFVENRLCRCMAVRGLLVPSIYERERFCRTDEPERCPTYQAYAAAESPLPQESYYQLWMPVVGPEESGATRVCSELTVQ